MATRIVIKDNGSIRVEGDFEIFDGKGGKYDLAGRTAITLCRCGQSRQKPFCDSTHKLIGFQSVCTAYALAPPQPKPAG